MHIPHYVN